MHTHLAIPVGDGGISGVDVFCVLSGFLITTLLLVERERWYRVALGRFYARRALRLFPALAFVLLGVGFYAALIAPMSRRGDMAAELAESAFYVRNLPFFHTPGLLLPHTWSLSLEEQFYLVWPCIFLL